jgi:hypothetical protein
MNKIFENLTQEEAIKLAASVREEDIDTSDIPNLGGVTQWHKAEERLTAKRMSKLELK